MCFNPRPQHTRVRRPAVIGHITAYLLLTSSFPLLSYSKSSRRLVQPPPTSCEELVFLFLPSRPRSDDNRHAGLAGKPLHPISTRKSHTFQPLSLQSWTKGWYFKAFLFCTYSIDLNCFPHCEDVLRHNSNSAL